MSAFTGSAGVLARPGGKPLVERIGGAFPGMPVIDERMRYLVAEALGTGGDACAPRGGACTDK